MRIAFALVALVLIGPMALAEPEPPMMLCVDADCVATPTDSTDSAGSIKWNPGHYMLVFLGESHESILSRRIPEICKESALQGLQMRLEWVELEPSKDNYDFTRVDEVYDALERCGKRLVLQVLAVKFNSDSTAFVPSYLLSDGKYNGGVAKTKTGHIARLWEAPTMDRLIALSRALAARYDGKPNFEGVILAETATSQVADGYTAGAFIGQLKRGVSEMVKAWPRTNVIVFNNFIQGSTEAQFVDFVKFLRENRATMGGPDTLPPPNDGTRGEKIYRGEIGGTDHRGHMPAMYAVQTPELSGKQGMFTPKQLYDHCVGTNRCSHMFWIRNVTFGGPEQQWETGILPFLRTGPKTTTRCPGNYPGCKT
jgi:hypothetical protein